MKKAFEIFTVIITVCFVPVGYVVGVVSCGIETGRKLAEKQYE